MAELKRIGIIGGSGLYNIEGLDGIEEVKLETPFGAPSDSYIKGKIKDKAGDVELIFLPRHGVGHRISPSEINSRANIYGFKKLGAKILISVSAVGSMKENIAPGDLVLVNQFIDRTKLDRGHTFFGNGVVAHVPLGEPTCALLRDVLIRAGKGKGKITNGGTYIAMEGPQFSTKAESKFYRTMGVDVIGMTACPEYKLAREAEMHFAVIALSTDYDCWKENEAHVTVDAVMEIMKNNVSKAKAIIKDAVHILSAEWDKFADCSCEHSLNNAIMTDRTRIPKETYSKLELLIGKYIKRS